MLRSIHVKNYKSLLDQKIELGRLNVFIGENGSGKTNFLESLAMASAALKNRLTQEDLFSRGIRIAKPSLMFASFSGQRREDCIRLGLVEVSGRNHTIEIQSKDPNDLIGSWSATFSDSWEKRLPTLTPKGLKELAAALKAAKIPNPKKSPKKPPKKLKTSGENIVGFEFSVEISEELHSEFTAADAELFDYCIYNLNILALRGTEVVSRRFPLGIHGENLDILISTFKPADFAALLKSARMVSWVDKVFVDARDLLKFKGLKAGRSTSTLYFQDRFMRRGNNILSAENANDGILHILFYIALFISDKTPKVFGIDNIETALNPQLCRELIKQLAILSKERNKQALITTHNPAILDGLDLHDDDQRLFVVHRNDEGHTVTKRIQMKPDTAGQYKLSELWMRGHLGGLPKAF